MNKNMANREVSKLTFRDYATKKPFLYADFANVTTTDLTGTAVYAYGGWGHPKRITFNGERGGTVTFETQIQPFKLYSLISGAEIETTAKFLKREVLSATAGSVTLSRLPVGDVDVFAVDDDCGVALEVTVTGKEVAITGATTGSYVAYYMENLNKNIQKLSIKGTTFPKYFEVFGETYNVTEDGEVVPYKWVAYKICPQSNFSLSQSNSGEPASLTVTCDIMEDTSGEMMDMILLEDAEDTVTTFGVTYDIGGGTGAAPVDANMYEAGETVTVLVAGAGITPPVGETFVGWANTAGAAAADYEAGGVTTFVMGDADVTLHAVYTV